MSGKVTWESESPKRGAPYRMGDDLCELVSNKTKIRSLPNRRFRKGLTVGFYYNSCGEKTWYDTEMRMPMNVCCDRDEKYVDCETAIAKRKAMLRRKRRNRKNKRTQRKNAAGGRNSRN